MAEEIVIQELRGRIRELEDELARMTAFRDEACFNGTVRYEKLEAEFNAMKAELSAQLLQLIATNKAFAHSDARLAPQYLQCILREMLDVVLNKPKNNNEKLTINKEAFLAQ